MDLERIQLSHDDLAAAIGGGWVGSDVKAAAELLAAGGGKFPPGIRTLPAELIDAVQRERLLAAMIRACAEYGYRDVTVQDVLDRAAISRPTFYELFENKEACFLAAFDSAAERLRGRLEAAAAAEADSWSERLRRSLEELLRFVGEEPDAAMVMIVEARAACPAALIHRDELMDRLAECIDARVRAEHPDPDSISAIAAAGTVGGIEALLYNRLSSGETEDLESLLPALMFFAVLPYDGPGAASAELGAAAR